MHAVSGAVPPPGEGATATPTSTAAPPEGFGLSRATSVEVCDPHGEHAYLRRLRCADGAPPQFQRRGSYGSRSPVRSEADQKAMLEQNLEGRAPRPGEPDFHTLDVYAVACSSGTTEVWMDMDHCEQKPPDQAPPGFTIVP